VLEALRLLAVVFFAGAGYQVGSSVDPDRAVLGALNGTAVGLIIGSGLGYVLGGVLGRKTAATTEVARTRLRDVSAEQLVAGALGTVGGVLVGAGVAWPVFFLPQAYLAFPLFGLRRRGARLLRRRRRDEQARRGAGAVRASGPGSRPARSPTAALPARHRHLGRDRRPGAGRRAGRLPARRVPRSLAGARRAAGAGRRG
jgi:hypothetical protein